MDESPAEAPLVARVFAKLADGQFHSGEDLAEQLAVSRSAVWKAAKALRELGATLHAVRNRGYRLVMAGEALDAQRIQALLTGAALERLKRVDTAWSVGSTNTVLMGRPNPPFGCGEALLAEYQTSGRGRRGRTWLAPPGGAICLSLSWTFQEVPRDLSALGLVIGVCGLRALGRLGVQDVRLKWPNDLLIEDRKLGGVLIELRAESGGPACVVIGIGLNVALGSALLARIAATGLAPVDLAGAGLTQPRNAVAAGLISEFVQGLIDVGHAGLKPFIEEWRRADALRDRPISVQAANGSSVGVARGIDPDGAFLVETSEGLTRLISGDVSVRAAS
jgi:BirA family biotin operon repressor/biotin-[acetyl-CoA-carboxylase] ligase